MDATGYVEVQLGALRTRVRNEQIERRGRREPGGGAVHYQGTRESPGGRLEVRGQTLDEALPTVEQFLDRAYRAGLQRLELVHGKGTGALRQAVRELLRSHPLVARFEAAPPHAGGEGVTVVHMAV